MRMQAVSGAKLDGRSLPQFVWNADLIAFDGPLVSLYRSDVGVDALFVWLDCDDYKNRWCIVDLDRDTLRDYLAQSMTLLDVFKASQSVVVFDVSPAIRRSNIIRTVWDRLPGEYLPKQGSFLHEEISTPEAKKLVAEHVRRYALKLDGELYLEDLAGIPKLYQQLYSFHYGLEHLGRNAVRGTLSSLMRRWNGGFSAVNLFTGLRNVIPSIHRARLEHLQYNSPGHITMELLPAMAERIRAAAQRISDRREEADELYGNVYKFFRTHGISGFEEERGSQEAKLLPSQLRELEEFVEQFFELMGWSDYRPAFVSLDAGPLSQIRALLAYYRRMIRILKYVDNCLLEFT